MKEDKPLTAEEVFKKLTPLSAEEIFKKSGILSAEEVFRPALKAKPTEEELWERIRKMQEYVDTSKVGAKDIFKGFEKIPGWFLEEASLGLTKPLTKAPGTEWARAQEAEGTGEKVAKELTRFLGFMTMPLSVGKVAGKAISKGAGKLLTKAPKIVQKAGRFAQYGLEHATTLGTAEAVRDVTTPLEAPERFVHGATIGTIFGIAGLSHVTKYKALNQVLSQFGGRALMALAGHYPQGYFTEENIGNAVFQEALNTAFLSKGIHPKALLSGKMTPAQTKLVDRVRKEIQEANKEAEVMGQSKLPLPEDVALNSVHLAIKDKSTGKVHLAKEGENHGLLANRLIKEGIVTEMDDMVSGFVGKKDKWMSRTEGRKIPGMEEAVEYITEDALATGEVIKKGSPIRSVTTFTYNTKTGHLSPLVGKYSEKLPSANEIKFERNPETGEVTFADKGKNIKADIIKANLESARKQLEVFDKAPYGKIDETLKRSLDDKVKELDLFIDDYRTFLKGLDIESKEATVADWVRVEERLSMLKELPPQERNDAFLKSIGLKDDVQIANKEVTELQKTDDALALKKQRTELVRAKKNTADERSNLSKILTLSPRQRLILDCRTALQEKQLETGIGFWDKYKPLVEAMYEARHGTKKLFKPLDDFGRLSRKDVRAVEEYYRRRADAYDKYPVEELPEVYDRIKSEFLTSSVREGIVEATDNIMVKVAPFVRYMRFKTWLEAKEKGLEFNEFKKQAELEPVLEEGRQIFYQGGESALWDWLSTKDFGTIEAGNYLPRVVLGRDHKLAYREEGNKAVEFMGRTHLEARKVDEGLVDFSEVMRTMPYSQRIHNYLRQIFNNYHMEKPLGEFAKIIRVFGNHIENTLNPGLRVSDYTFYDDLKLMIHRMKGYPIKSSMIGKMVKGVTRTFFRAFPVKPYPWLRNLCQPGALSPHKEIVLDPRWQARRFNRLPEHAQENFYKKVIQFDSIRHDFFYLENTRGLIADLPGVRSYLDFVEKVGMFYGTTDTVNRQRTYTPMYHASKHYLDLWGQGKIDYKTVESKLGLNKLRPLERRDFRELAGNGKMEEASLYMAKWEALNTNFMYDRSQKSFEEMTAIGEVSTNLLTWTKGAVQIFDNAVGRIKEGMQGSVNPAKWNWKKIGAGTEVLITTAILGEVINKLLESVTFSHFRKYKDYSPKNMLWWEFGGVSFSIIRDFADAVSIAMNAFDHDENTRQKALETVVRLMDNVALRQLTPFANQALGILESLTGRSYIEPIRNIILKKGNTRVDREVIEKFTHAFFAKDPDKRASTLKFAIMQREKADEKARTAQSSIRRAWYLAEVKRWTYLVELFDRYQPEEIEEYIMEREWNKKLEKFEPDAYYERLAEKEMERRKKLREMERK